VGVKQKPNQTNQTKACWAKVHFVFVNFELWLQLTFHWGKIGKSFVLKVLFID
jgi:hypothetical protein